MLLQFVRNIPQPEAKSTTNREAVGFGYRNRRILDKTQLNRYKTPMKPEELLIELKNVAERLGVVVEEHNFREAGVRVKSGLCTVRGEKLFILDKHKALPKKIEILSSMLAQMPLDDVYIVPAVRACIMKSAGEEDD